MSNLKIILNIFYPPTEQLKEKILNHLDLFFPINGGSTLKDDSWCSNHIQMDNTGDNISILNSLLNEMTSIYWFWKNKELPAYVGFNHYRRFFKLDDIQDYENYDIIVSKPIWSSDTISLAYQYKHYHVLNDLQICIDTIREKVGQEYGEEFRQYLLHTGTNYAPCNMFVMKKELFVEWCEFIFPLLFELKKRICDTDEFIKRDNYQKRALCFLTERMFNFWYFKKKQTLKTKELTMEEHLEYKPDGVNERGDYSKKLPRVALVAIAKDEDEYLKEWVDYHLKIGFDDIFVYQNNWRYAKNDIHDSKVHLEIRDGKRQQVPCYNDFILKNHSNYDFIAFFDIDEFFYIKDGRKVPEFLNDYKDKEAIYINWRLFGDNGLEHVTDNNYSVLNRFYKCDDKLNRLGKPIINVAKTKSSIIFNNPHILVFNDVPLREFRPFEPLGIKRVAYGSLENNDLNEPCELYHYRNKTWDETLKRRLNTDDAFWDKNFKSRYDMETIKQDFKNHNTNILLNRNLCTNRFPTVALIGLVKNENNYLKEWVDYNLKIGFDDIYIFQNNWRYTRGDISNPKVHFETIDINAPQVICYNTCVERFVGKYDFIACFDIDEFLYIKDGSSVPEFLSHYMDKEAIYVNWRIFGDNNLKGVQDGNYSVLKRFTRCDDKLSILGKVFLNLELTKGGVIYHNPHILVRKDNPMCEFRSWDPLCLQQSSSGCLNATGDEPCELYHYRNKTWEELIERRYNKSDVFSAVPNSSHTDMNQIKKEFDEQNKNILINNNLRDVL